ncbi:hypothetical protein NP233_g10871 [Leucocoprinus birnbaumii]|uniref:Phosphotransferase n=1 Tax=Leucocoprinus birnbaumii TaxID=56174 RepID=A0AAD5YPF9_9AGAR|nr:hypothetical protein NP233_g10871 [Leucocoprinus birnbaumii]
MPASRRGSGTLTLPSGQTMAIHTRTHDEEDLPHATKKTMADHLRRLESLFTLTPQRMRMIVEAFKDALELGLEKPKQVVPMIPTYVFGWPTGKEQGDFLAIDLGGTNLRVCLVTVQGEGQFEITQSKYRLTEEQKQEDGQKLFDFCAECLKTFIDTNLAQEDGGFTLKEGETLPLGFTFSYPCSQDKIDHGVLIRWTKGFGAPNTEGFDVAEMFRKSLAKYGAFDAFEHEHLPRTKYDVIVDESSNKPHEQSFEKLIAGRYLGEILRLVICELIDEGVLFLGQNTYKLEVPYSFDSAFLSLMESDPTDELLMIIGIFTHFFAVETTLAERQFFRALAKLIGRRAARLSACGIAAIVSKMGYLDEGCSVGADGSLYNKYPGFADRIHEGLMDIFGDKGSRLFRRRDLDAQNSKVEAKRLNGTDPAFPLRRNIVTHHAEDGSGVGSAIIAVIAPGLAGNSIGATNRSLAD